MHGRVPVVWHSAFLRFFQPTLPTLQLGEESAQTSHCSPGAGRKYRAYPVEQRLHLALEIARQHFTYLVDRPERLDNGMRPDVAGEVVLGWQIFTIPHKLRKGCPCQGLAIVGGESAGSFGGHNGYGSARDISLLFSQDPARSTNALQ